MDANTPRTETERVPPAAGDGRPPEEEPEELDPEEEPVPEITATHRARKVPLLRVLAYYIVLVGIAVALATWFPIVRQALVSPITIPAVDQAAVLSGEVPSQPAGFDPSLAETLDRSLITFVMVLGALALVLPVAWVYMYTKRLRYDPSLVQSVIILPMVVGGILLIVKNSLALAFSLAGIVAAVRFRNTLKDPKDAVYIFLAIGIGIAAGVQALDVALVISLAFNFVVMVLWKYNVGAIYSRGQGPRGILSIGPRKYLVAQDPDERRRFRRELLEEAQGMKTDGILLVHAPDPQPARHAVEVSLSQTAKDWKLAEVVPGAGGLSTLEFLIRMKKKKTVVDLLGQIDDRWAAQVVAAEFIPFKTKKNQKKLR